MSSKKDPTVSDNEIKIYTLTYKDLNRILKIRFENKFPFPIIGWEEIYESGWDKNARELTTRAIRTNTIFTDYWSKNSVSDSTYRIELGL